MDAGTNRRDATRAGEVEVPLPARQDAHLVFIGRIRTPFQTREDCPRRGAPDGPVCRIEIDQPWRAALKGIERFNRLEILYWMHLARRDLVLQSPKKNGETHGTFSLRSPVRPNPIATSTVELVALEPDAILVRGLDCVDGTPLIDVKPDRCMFAGPLPAGAEIGT